MEAEYENTIWSLSPSCYTIQWGTTDVRVLTYFIPGIFKLSTLSFFCGGIEIRLDLLLEGLYLKLKKATSGAQLDMTAGMIPNVCTALHQPLFLKSKEG